MRSVPSDHLITCAATEAGKASVLSAGLGTGWGELGSPDVE